MDGKVWILISPLYHLETDLTVTFPEQMFNSFLASGDFCCLLTPFASSLQRSAFNQFDTLIVFLKELFEEVPIM